MKYKWWVSKATKCQNSEIQTDDEKKKNNKSIAKVISPFWGLWKPTGALFFSLGTYIFLEVEKISSQSFIQYFVDVPSFFFGCSGNAAGKEKKGLISKFQIMHMNFFFLSKDFPPR